MTTSLSTVDADLTESNTTENLSEPLLRPVSTKPPKQRNANVDYGDERQDMTYARRVSKFLRRFACYYPIENRRLENVSLEQGWEYFEHITLARHFVNEDGSNVNENGQLEKAEPGENSKPTRLVRRIQILSIYSYLFFRHESDE